jgi:hypothetical protein
MKICYPGNSLLFVIALAVALISVTPLTFADETKISVLPSRNTLYTGSTPVNSTFSVNVSVINGVNVWNWQVNFTFDPSLLQCVSAIIPSDSPFLFPVAPDPYVDNDNGYVLIGASKLGTQPPINASGTLTTITLKIIKAPTTSTPLTCPLNLAEGTRLKDNKMQDLPATLEPGHYEYYYSEVNVHNIDYLGETFTIITESNATITPIPMLLKPEERQLTFNITGTEGKNGFVRIIIPYDFMHDDWHVSVDGEPITSEISTNATHTILQFVVNLTGQNQQVSISASWLVPEFQPYMLLLVLFAVILPIIFAAKKSRKS